MPGSTLAEAAPTRPSDKELQGYTVEKLKQLLKDKGQPVKGKKVTRHDSVVRQLAFFYMSFQSRDRRSCYPW